MAQKHTLPFCSRPVADLPSAPQAKGANPEGGGIPLRTYEVVYIVQSDLDEEALTAFSERIQNVITANGGEIVKVDSMGRRRLAYPIQKRQAGYYMLMHARMERPAILEMERALRLSEDVLRYIVVRLDEVEPVEESVGEPVEEPFEAPVIEEPEESSEVAEEE
jgi:small subunit ribosomal protein S6